MNQIKDFLEYVLNAFKFWIIIQPWESGIRIRNGKNTKLIEKGIHFRFPFFDSVYVQETRLRIMGMSPQTVTSIDGQTITVNSSIGYSISSVEKLYNTLYHPELTICNYALGSISEYIGKNKASDCKQELIEAVVLKSLNEFDYGLDFEYCKITSLAVVKTFRLIQDNSYNWEGLKMDVKK